MKATKEMTEKFMYDFDREVKDNYLFTSREIFEQTGMKGRSGIFLELSKPKFERVCELLDQINERAKGEFKISIVNKKRKVIHIENLNPERGS